MTLRPPGWCLLALLLGTPGPAAAQFRAGADALVASSYVFRGVTRTNGYVLQPDAYVAYGLGGAGWLTAGVWGNVELERSGDRDISDRPYGTSGLGERDAWVQLTRGFGAFDVTAGWIGYFRRANLVAGPSERYDTHELYATVQDRTANLSPRLSAWWDVSRIDGLYLESSVSVPLMGSFPRTLLGVLSHGHRGAQPGPGREPRSPSRARELRRGWIHPFRHRGRRPAPATLRALGVHPDRRAPPVLP